MASSLELRLGGCSARFFKRRSPGESGGDGELTGAEKNDREAMMVARHSTDGNCRGGARARRDYGLRGRKACGKMG